MTQFHGKVENGELRFSHNQLVMRSRFLSSLKTCSVTETITRVSDPRSLQQIKAYWKVVVGTIKGAFDDRGWDMSMLHPDLDLPPGYPVTRDTIHDILNAACNDVGPDGERKRISSPMSPAEMCEFYERCNHFAAIKWNIYIPDPDPAWRENKE